MSERRWSLRNTVWGFLRNTVWGFSLVGVAGVLLACGQDAPPPELPPRAIRWMSVSGSMSSRSSA